MFKEFLRIPQEILREPHAFMKNTVEGNKQKKIASFWRLAQEK